ncbi:unnamed protein product [Chironomus riparius]|uniref:Rhodanese domain-containing protein n=1 Tax=Chironomus riparius TaxID=315576 RepID=A0A9N9WLX1_9DIPT|nr:unnamed protein product [Chironomus riparius]
MNVEVAIYHEIIEAIVDPEVLLIDVRDPQEIAATGSIPTSINIPLAKIPQELKLSRLAFVAKYQRNKPSLSHKLIFYCKFGDLSQTAAEEAVNIGYKNVRNYKAGYSEWTFKWKEWDDYVDPEKFKQQERYKEL